LPLRRPGASSPWLPATRAPLAVRHQPMRAAPPSDSPGGTAPSDSRFRGGDRGADRRSEAEVCGGRRRSSRGRRRGARGVCRERGRASERWCGPRRFSGDLGINRRRFTVLLTGHRRRVTSSLRGWFGPSSRHGPLAAMPVGLTSRPFCFLTGPSYLDGGGPLRSCEGCVPVPAQSFHCSFPILTGGCCRASFPCGHFSTVTVQRRIKEFLPRVHHRMSPHGKWRGEVNHVRMG